MCSTEAALCKAIQQVYGPPLATFFFAPFHHMTEWPLPAQSITLRPLTAAGLRLWGRGGGERERKVKNRTPQSHHGSRRLPSIASLAALGGGTACDAVHADQLWNRGSRIVWPGLWEGKPPDPTAPGPQPRHLSLFRSIGGDRKAEG